MNKTFIYALMCAGFVGLSACSDFLDEDPKSSLTSAGYYQTEAQALANVNYLYRHGAPTRFSSASSAYIGPFVSIPGQLTGYFTNSYEGQELVCQYSRLLTRQSQTMTVSSTMDGVWDNCYASINVANGAIKNIPNISMAESTSKQLIAEAKFFRAFNYFLLVKTFGDVPMPTEPYTSMADDLYPTRTATSEVYALIESDLKYAYENLSSSTFANNGHRITKWVAAMVLTDVYMRENKYSEAATYAKAVISSPHSLTTNDDLAMNSAYNKLRTTDDLSEAIYAYEFDNSISNGSWWPTYSMSSSATSVFNKYAIFERVYGPTNRYLNVYEDNDLRIQPNQFFHWEYTNPNSGAKWTAPNGQAGCWYYFDEDALLNTGRATKDFNFYRYAEALLDGAEAIAQSSGVNAEAAGYLAQVQARANMAGKTVAELTTSLQTLSKDEFIQACWVERLREFPLEFKIWDDCVRTGKFPVISETEKGKVDFVDLIGAKNAAGATFKASDLLWPISLNEMQRNPNLTQNDGYATK
jgi:hypothetical protein